ncbi:MAG: hypothetical protein KL787_02995 [Taibaiella sp.]|nr:hypothetical protein [Taibaiella sp.]
MYSFILLTCFIGVFCLYNTSKRAKLSKNGPIEIWLQAHPQPAKYAGVSLVLTSITVFVIKDGWGAGLFSSSLLLMTAPVCIVTFAPFYYIRIQHIAAIIALSVMLEFLIF